MKSEFQFVCCKVIRAKYFFTSLIDQFTGLVNKLWQAWMEGNCLDAGCSDRITLVHEIKTGLYPHFWS